jgi:hypothetical protein
MLKEDNIVATHKRLGGKNSVNINQKCEETSTENVRKHQLFL